MGILNLFDKLDDIVYKPIETACEWIKEPLKHWEADRKIKEMKAASEIKKSEETHKEDLLEKQKEHEYNMKMSEKEKDIDLQIKKETETDKIFMEIEQRRKDKEFERMKNVYDAITKYQQELTKFKVDTLKVIAHMQLDLRSKAQDLITEKVKQYKNIQDEAHKKAMNDFKTIEQEFPNNERAKDILYTASEATLTNIIETAHGFLKNLNEDITVINNTINILAQQGQKAVDDYVKDFRRLGPATLNEIEGK